jgi:hypothetical protein
VTNVRKWIPLVGLITGHFINDFYQYTLPLLLPFLLPEFGLSYFEGGVLVAVYYGVSVIMNPMVGS